MPYSKGKSSSLAGRNGINYSMGKKSNSTGAKVGYSAGNSSGTRRSGDKRGSPAMSKGK